MSQRGSEVCVECLGAIGSARTPPDHGATTHREFDCGRLLNPDAVGAEWASLAGVLLHYPALFSGTTLVESGFFAMAAAIQAPTDSLAARRGSADRCA